MYSEDKINEQKIYGQSENGNIVCLGVRLEDGSIGEMPTYRYGDTKRINNQALVGSKIVFYNKDRNKYYDIDILEYIKSRHAKFIVKYQNEEKKEIQCGNFIKVCNIGNVVNEDLKIFQSLNTFRKVDDYYIMTIETKGTKAEEDFNGGIIEIVFDGSEEVVKGIMNSSWYLNKLGKSKDTYYIQTNSYNQTGQNIRLHQAVFNQEIPKGMVINHINRIGGSWRDNRISNLELASKKENAKNKAGAGFPRKNGKGWCYYIRIEDFLLQTPLKQDYNKADTDALIVQEYFGFSHRADEFYKIENIDQEYKNNLIQLMEQKLEKAKSKGSIFTKNEFEIIEIDGVEVAKVFDTKGRYCFIDKEDIGVLDLGRIRRQCSKKGYWSIKINNKEYMLHRYLLGIKETDKFHNIQVDHINQNRCDNRKENLRITTEAGNKANKNGLGYGFLDNRDSYQVSYKSYHDILKQHNQISNTATPTFKTELEAQEEVYKRKYLANYIMPKFKNLNEYLSFEKEYNTHKKDGQTLDDYWITTRFPNINEIEIPKFSEENVDKL